MERRATMEKQSPLHPEDGVFCLNPNHKGTRAEPEDCVIGLEAEQTKVKDFWRWAFSDFCDDALKGDYAEWLVSILLGVRTERRRYWANTDLVSQPGVRIEVKSSSYWQSWKLWEETGKPKCVKVAGDKERRRIRFAGLKVGDAVGNVGYKSDLYVFAFQAQRDPSLWNAFDLSQWEFYMLTKQELEEIGAKSLSLDMVSSRSKKPMAATEFSIEGRKKLREIELNKQQMPQPDTT